MTTKEERQNRSIFSKAAISVIPASTNDSNFNELEVKYGSKMIDGVKWTYVKYVEPDFNQKIVLLSKPYGDLIVFRDNKRSKTANYMESMMWTKVCGWLGMAAFQREMEKSKN